MNTDHDQWALGNPKKVAVIGAGPSGLTALKALKEIGHTVVGYESQSSLGGLWNYEDEANRFYMPVSSSNNVPVGGCYQSLKMNTSKNMSEFSDFPVPESYSTCMTHWEYSQYLQLYAKEFELVKYIKFNCEVIKLTRTKGKFDLHYRNEEGNQLDHFDLVLIATGTFRFPCWPNFKGEENFSGIVIHSSQVRRDKLFENKRVLIVGGSVSGAEMVTNASNGGAKNIYWVVNNTERESGRKRNHWILDRWPDSNSSMMWDCNMTRETFQLKPSMFFGKFCSWIKSIHRADDQSTIVYPGDQVAISDASLIENGLMSGKIRKVANVKEFDKSSICLLDDITLNNIDIVIYATGFVQRFPFLDDLWDKQAQREIHLYCHMLPVENQLQGLAFVGMSFSFFCSLFRISEMQSRWLASFWASRLKPFSNEELEAFQMIIDEHKKGISPYGLLVEPYKYTDELAKDIGCLPPGISGTACEDESLNIALLRGPLISAQYRINGPNAWSGAKEYIKMKAQEIIGSN